MIHFIIADIDPPTFSPPCVNMTYDLLEPTVGTHSVEGFAPTVTDNNLNYNVTVSCTPPPGSMFERGETLVECTASDEDGNTAFCAFYVILM